jgi:predicted transcriptional regulator
MLLARDLAPIVPSSEEKDILAHITLAERNRAEARLRYETDMAQIGRKCRNYRNSLKIAMADLAKEMKVTTHWIYGLETGRQRWRSDIVKEYLDAMTRLKNRPKSRRNRRFAFSAVIP